MHTDPAKPIHPTFTELLNKQPRVIRYLSAEALKEDDFGEPFTHEEGEIVYDAATVSGAWATMTQKSWAAHRRSTALGLGIGQCYVRQENGELHKVSN